MVSMIQSEPGMQIRKRSARSKVTLAKFRTALRSFA